MTSQLAPAADPRRGRAGPRSAALASAALGALVFLPALWSGRIADDFVLEQTLQRAGGIGWAFSHNDLGQGSGHFYRPLWVLWNLLLFHISGSPLLAHVGNLALFALLCCEVVGIVWLLTRGAASAWTAGLLFAVFPSHGESVAWISGNTDLLAGVLALGCVLLALGLPAGWRRELAVFLTAAAAMLAKEIAFVLPVLLALTMWAGPAEPSVGSAGWSSARWRPAWVALLTAVLVLIVHEAVIGGTGGYGPAFTLRRLAGSAVTFVLGTFSLPQMPLFRHPVFLVIPLALLVMGVALAVQLLRSTDRPRRRRVMLGVGWFVVALVPVLNQPLDLNTRNGDRLLLLASVGFVIALGALLEHHRRPGRLMLGVLVLCGAASCAQNAVAWHAAGVESTRLIHEVDQLTGPSGAVAVLSFPTDLGQAHVFPDGLRTAVQESGRPDALIITCAPMHPGNLRSGQTRFRAGHNDVWFGRTSSSNPFAVGVLSAGSVSAGPGCETGRITPGPSAGLGTTLRAYSKPLIRVEPENILYFDGRDFKRAP